MPFNRMRGSMCADDDLTARGRLYERLPDQRTYFGAPRLLRGLKRDSSSQGDVLGAAHRESGEDPGRERFALLFVCDIPWLKAAFGRRPGDDLLVDIEEAEAIGDQAADIVAARAGRMGDAHDTARHARRR